MTEQTVTAQEWIDVPKRTCHCFSQTYPWFVERQCGNITKIVLLRHDHTIIHDDHLRLLHHHLRLLDDDHLGLLLDHLFEKIMEEGGGGCIFFKMLKKKNAVFYI